MESWRRLSLNSKRLCGWGAGNETQNNIPPLYLLHKERSAGEGKLETYFSLNNKPQIQKCAYYM